MLGFQHRHEAERFLDQLPEAFDRDPNQAGQRASRLLAQRLKSAGLRARIVPLPPGQDPNSYFAAGATATDFLACLEQAQLL